jgi:hypothetical protein
MIDSRSMASTQQYRTIVVGQAGHSLALFPTNTKHNAILIAAIDSAGFAVERFTTAFSRTKQLILWIRVVFI